MRKYFIILFISLFFSMYFGVKLDTRSAAREQIVFQNLQSGMEWFEGMIQTEGEPFKLSGVRVDISQYSLEVAAASLKSSLSVSEYQRRFKAFVALSGGFLKSFFPPIPLGLVKSDDRILNRPQIDSLLSGIFCSRKGEITIEPFTEEKAEILPSWEHCLQSGPLLMYEGSIALDEIENYRVEESWFTTPYNRAFVAVDPEGRALLGITGETTIPALVELLQRPADEGGLGCSAALNLSGIDVGLVVDVAGERLTAGDIDFYRPANAIIVRPK